MRSRRPGSWWPLGDTRVSGRRVTSKAPLWPTWKEGQAAPRRRPQPFSRILTAWKGYSANFAVASDPSGAAAGARQRHGATPSTTKRVDLAPFVAPMCSKRLRHATAQLLENSLAHRDRARPNFALTAFSEVRYPQATPMQHQRYVVWGMCHTLQSCYATSQEQAEAQNPASRREGGHLGAWGASSATGCLLSPYRDEGRKGWCGRHAFIASYLTPTS